MKENSPEAKLAELRAHVRRFMHDVVYPLEKQSVGRSLADLQRQLDAARPLAKKRGLWLPQLAAEWGGQGLSLVEFAQISEELGRSPYGHYLCNCQAPDAGNMEILIAHATPQQQQRFLQPLLRGEVRSCFAMTEPEHAGSNPVLMNTTARREGDTYVLNGHKWFATAADGSAFAIVMAVTNPEAESPYARTSMLIVPTDTPGYRLVRNLPVMGEAGHGFMSHGELRFENCRIPRSNLLGNEGEGFKIAQQRLGPGRIHHCMRWIGICERAFEMMCRRALSRNLAADKPLASMQTVQNWIAESRAEIDAARLLVLETARKIVAEGNYAARVEVSEIKFFVARVLQEALDRALQVHGALGMTDDLPLAFWYRHERAARIYDGPDEVHKSRVAREILKSYQPE